MPEHTDYIREIMRISKHFRRNVENICTQEMTEIGGFIRHYRLKYADVENEVKSMCALRKELGLTERALCYALLAARNHSNAEIAEICNTTTDSVKSSLKRIFAKLGLRSRSQLRYVLRLE